MSMCQGFNAAVGDGLYTSESFTIPLVPWRGSLVFMLLRLLALRLVFHDLIVFIMLGGAIVPGPLLTGMQRHILSEEQGSISSLYKGSLWKEIMIHIIVNNKIIQSVQKKTFELVN